MEIQSSVVGALSTAEAEFAAASSMVEQITYFYRFLERLDFLHLIALEFLNSPSVEATGWS